MEHDELVKTITKLALEVLAEMQEKQSMEKYKTVKIWPHHTSQSRPISLTKVKIGDNSHDHTLITITPYVNLMEGE